MKRGIGMTLKRSVVRTRIFLLLRLSSQPHFYLFSCLFIMFAKGSSSSGFFAPNT